MEHRAYLDVHHLHDIGQAQVCVAQLLADASEVEVVDSKLARAVLLAAKACEELHAEVGEAESRDQHLVQAFVVAERVGLALVIADTHHLSRDHETCCE